MSNSDQSLKVHQKRKKSHEKNERFPRKQVQQKTERSYQINEKLEHQGAL